MYHFAHSACFNCLPFYLSTLLLKWFNLLHPLHDIPYCRHCLCWSVDPQCLKLLSCCLALTCYFFLVCFYFLFTALNSLFSTKLSNIAVCNLCTSTHFAHVSISSLVMSLVFFIEVDSLIILFAIASLFRQFMNCSSNLL